ncbi:MAG: hypothetical protein NC238_15630 [Dehalobacter sp.]|nr:hypothetical protein [Dehalobacter sp.]
MLGFRLESKRGGKVTLNGEIITESCFEKDNECESYLILNMKYSDAGADCSKIEVMQLYFPQITKNRPVFQRIPADNFD